MDKSQTHYLCERCGGTGQQEAGCYDWTKKTYDAPAGECQLCGGEGYLGPKVFDHPLDESCTGDCCQPFI